MPELNEVVESIATAPNWDARVALIRKIPEEFGAAQHAGVYAEIARRVYVPKLQAEFAYVHWRDDYELDAIERAYTLAKDATSDFTKVAREVLSKCMNEYPETLRIFRLLLGLTGSEFAEACSLVAERLGLPAMTKNRVKNIEAGRHITPAQAETCAAVIDLAMTGALFPPKPGGGALRLKLDKPDTAHGWKSVREYAVHGVPLSVFLHQRAYGGAFRQLLDATSSHRGDLLEDPVEELFVEAGIPFIRTGAHNQAAVEADFGVTVHPAPDFIVYENRNGNLRAMLECKGASDGGTARDKAARYRSLRAEAQRLGGVPLFAVLGGIGWRRAADALGPVIRDTDGRVFTLVTLSEMIETEPFPGLRSVSSEPQ